MKIIKNLLISFFITFIFSLVVLYAEIQTKTDFKVGAKIIGVADPDYKEYSYIDMGTAHGVKPGDRFMVEGKYGKVMVEVVQAFQRMSAIKIVDSWLLNEGNTGEMIPASRYPKIRINKYVEKTKDATVLASKKLTPQKSKPKVSTKVKKVEVKKEVETLPEEVSAEALIPEEAVEVVTPSFEEAPEKQISEEFSGMTGVDTDSLTEISDDELFGEIDTALVGENTLPDIEPSMEEIGLSTDTDTNLLLPTDSEPELPADIDLVEPNLPSDDDDLSVMPGDALPSLP